MLFSFILSFSVAAESLSIRSDDNGIFLESEDCDLLKDEVEQIAQWAHRLNETPNPVVLNKFSNRCSVNIKSILPKLAAETHGKFPAHNGPNCFNTGLVLSGLLPHFRNSDPQELRFWLESPLCKKLPPSHRPIPGDIGVVTNPSAHMDEHAFIYVSDRLSFGKNGYMSIHPFFLQVSDIAYGLKSKNSGCHRRVNSETCTVQLDYYHCIPHNQKDLDALECQVSQTALHDDKIDDALESTLAALEASLANSCNDNPLKMLLLKVRLMKQQTSFNRLTPSQNTPLRRKIVEDLGKSD
jgi:hypothetical protein